MGINAQSILDSKSHRLTNNPQVVLAEFGIRHAGRATAVVLGRLARAPQLRGLGRTPQLRALGPEPVAPETLSLEP